MSKEILEDLNYRRRNLDTDGITNRDESPVARESALKGMVRMSVGPLVVSESMYFSQTVQMKVYGGSSPQYTEVDTEKKDGDRSFTDFMIKYGNSGSK